MFKMLGRDYNHWRHDSAQFLVHKVTEDMISILFNEK